jgi:hypothetical protein
VRQITRVAYTGESTKILFSQKLTGVGYIGESGLSGVGYTSESVLTSVGYTGESRLCPHLYVIFSVYFEVFFLTMTVNGASFHGKLQEVMYSIYPVVSSLSPWPITRCRMYSYWRERRVE